MNERSTRRPDANPDASGPFLRIESDFARAVGRRLLHRPSDFVLPPCADAPAHEH